MRPLLAALIPKAVQDNVPNRARLKDIVTQTESKKAAHHEYHIELDDLRGEERKAQRHRMAQLLAEIATLEEDRVRLESELREAERMSEIDYDERVRAGIARLQAGDEIERENARQALNGMLAERVEVVMYDNRYITVIMRGNRGAGFVTFTPDQIVDAGALDEHGRRVIEMDDVWLPLARVAMGLENFRAIGAKLAVTLEEIAVDPIIREALVAVQKAA
jgi:hypothetical protein